jgi:hypothetical protein
LIGSIVSEDDGIITSKTGDNLKEPLLNKIGEEELGNDK